MEGLVFGFMVLFILLGTIHIIEKTLSKKRRREKRYARTTI